MNVSTDLQDLMVRANQDGSVAAAKERAVPLYAHIDETGKAAEQELHAGKETPFPTPYQQMKVVAHKAIGMNLKVKPGGRKD